jgi:hypothetical protein
MITKNGTHLSNYGRTEYLTVSKSDVHVTPTIYMTCNDDAWDVRRHNRNIMFTKYWNSNHVSWPTNTINKIKIGGGSMTNLTLICFDHNSIFIQSLLNVHLFASFMCVNWWKHYKKLRIVQVWLWRHGRALELYVYSLNILLFDWDNNNKLMFFCLLYLFWKKK